MNALTTTSNGLVPGNVREAMDLAEFMAGGKLVPNHLQKSPADCLMVIEQAMRWGMSPFAVAQATSVIQGKLMFEGKLVAAAVHSSGILAGRLSYEFKGAGDSRAITVSGTLKGEGAPRSIEVAFKDAKTANQMWQKQPDQQLVYHGTRVWARRHAPEVMLGVYSPEEFEAPPMRDVTPSAPPPPPAVQKAGAGGGSPPPAAAPAAPPANGSVAALKWLNGEFKTGLEACRDAADVSEYTAANADRMERINANYPQLAEDMAAMIAERMGAL